MTTSAARVVVISKPGCHLCDVASELVAAVCDELEVEWRVGQLADLSVAEQARWADQVPVISVDGRVLDIYRTSAARLRAALTR